MSNELIGELIAILVLVLANGFFALAEFSVIASRKSKLREKVEAGKLGAEKAEELHARPEAFLATIQVGITLVAALLGVFSGATIVRKLEVVLAATGVEILANAATVVAMVIVVIFITILSVVVGELVPKYVALSFPEKWARYVAGPITVFVRVTSFFSRALSWMATKIVHLLGIRTDADGRHVTEDEINLMVVEGKEKGLFNEIEQEFIRSVFDFSDSTVRRAMKPRADVVGFDINTPPKEILEGVLAEGYSRFPIYEDTIDQVRGVIYAKDLIGVDFDDKDFSIEELIRQPLFVPDSMPLTVLLREFQKGKGHIAIVLDEFGGTFGIITLEDVLEELVGEIKDEYDEEAAPIVRHSDTIAYADGTVWPGEINELLNAHLPEDQAETLAGLFIDAVGRFPEKHESVEIEDMRLTVLAKDENRILRLRLTKLPQTVARPESNQ